MQPKSALAAGKQEGIIFIPEEFGQYFIHDTGYNANGMMRKLADEVNIKLKYESAYGDELHTESRNAS